MIYITLSVDTYIDTFAVVLWTCRTIKGKLPLLNPLCSFELSFYKAGYS